VLVGAPHRRVLAGLLGKAALSLLARGLLLAELLGLTVVHVSLAYARMTRFHAHYDEWTERRIGWIVANFGEDVVRGRTVLDVGGGRGHVAERLLDMGAASVEVVEGRLDNIRAGASRPGLTFTHANLERGLQAPADAYDVVINFGIIYHVVNWERMLIESVAKARELVFIETEVIDSESEATRYVLEDQAVYDWALAGVGTRPSEFEVDRLLARIPNAQPEKILDAALNAEFHRYDWEPQLEGLVEHGLRRFWTVRRSPDAGDDAERRALDRLLGEVREAKAIDTLIIARRTQELLERGPGPAEPPPPPPPPPSRAEPAARDFLELLARLAPMQSALEPVEPGAEQGTLDRSRRFAGTAAPVTCTDEEGLVLHELIVANGLRAGFEIPTGLGYSAAFAGAALQRHRGTLISMDSFADPQTSRDALMTAVAEVMERVGSDDPPAVLAFVSEQLSALGLDEVVTLSIGISPESVPDAIFARALDFVLIGLEAQATLDAVLPQLHTDRCAVVFHGDPGEPAVAAAEQALGSKAVVFPTRYRLTLVGRNLDPASVSAAESLLIRSSA
jgi:SAM-dependent methyltransferase